MFEIKESAAATVTPEQIAQAVARGWCHPSNTGKALDVELATAIAREVQKVVVGAPGAGLAAVLDELEEFLEGQQDVVDGSYGEQRPNRAMSLLADLQRARRARPADALHCIFCEGEGWMARPDPNRKPVEPPQTHNYAPDGKLWQCGACGKIAKDQYGEEGGWDESCMLNSYLIDDPNRTGAAPRVGLGQEGVE